MHAPRLQEQFFRLLLIISTAAFVWVVFPMFGAVLWGVVFAIVCTPFNRRLHEKLRLPQTLAAIVTTLLVLLLVILPSVIIAGFIVQEATDLVQRVRTGEIDLASYYRRAMDLLPQWLAQLLEGAGLKDLPSLQERLKQGSAEAGAQPFEPIARRIWTMGQSTLDFSVNFLVMLYLLFFLLRDGSSLMQRIKQATPLDRDVQRRLFRNFSAVVRSTVKGNIVVAAIQGALGAIALMVLGIPGALLWGVIMAFLSLLPAVGAALVWAPIAAYLIGTGDVGKGIALAVFGTLVIGLVDNVLRPMLVGKETRMPDWVVLISTIGGMSLLGISGFVIGPVIAALFIAVWDIASTSQDSESMSR